MVLSFSGCIWFCWIFRGGQPAEYPQISAVVALLFIQRFIFTPVSASCKDIILSCEYLWGFFLFFLGWRGEHNCAEWWVLTPDVIARTTGRSNPDWKIRLLLHLDHHARRAGSWWRLIIIVRCCEFGDKRSSSPSPLWIFREEVLDCFVRETNPQWRFRFCFKTQ